MTEQDIIKRCIAGERLAQQALYERYSPKMYAVCRRYAKHDFEAQDMLQEGFIRVFLNTSKLAKMKALLKAGFVELWFRQLCVLCKKHTLREKLCPRNCLKKATMLMC